MAKIIWSYKAYEDYKSIIEFIAIDSEHYASLIAKKIWLEIKRIEKNPKEARMVPEAGYLDDIREFIYEIEEYSHVSSLIHPGDKLIIPLYEGSK